MERGRQEARWHDLETAQASSMGVLELYALERSQPSSMQALPGALQRKRGQACATYRAYRPMDSNTGNADKNDADAGLCLCAEFTQKRGKRHVRCARPRDRAHNGLQSRRSTPSACRACEMDFRHNLAYLCHPDGRPGKKQTHAYFPPIPRTLRRMKGANAFQYIKDFRAWPPRKRDRDRARRHGQAKSHHNHRNARRNRAW